jgi:hypothetical protein
MNNQTYKNLCSRCGTERIVVKVWEEKLGNSIIVNTETACPDKACQKEVEKENKKQRDKNTAMRLRQEQRAQERKAGKEAAKKQKSK